MDDWEADNIDDLEAEMMMESQSMEPPEGIEGFGANIKRKLFNSQSSDRDTATKRQKSLSPDFVEDTLPLDPRSMDTTLPYFEDSMDIADTVPDLPDLDSNVPGPPSPPRSPSPRPPLDDLDESILESDQIPVTSTRGERVYFKMHKDMDPVSALKGKGRDSLMSLRGGQLLDQPIEEILAVVEQQEYMTALERSNTSANNEFSSPDGEGGSQTVATKLWVDKYAPQSFVDLVSDQRTNRDILRWIKSWDNIVFGKDSSTRSNPPSDASSGPEKKVMLLCGPPGLGKTTLAHVLAKQAGYQAVEINGSDDRSAEKLKSKLQDSTQMRNVYMDQRPNLVIVDEIDGESKQAIESLISIVNGTSNKKQQQSLLRPVICICNDLYSPVLRPLREVAVIHKFYSPTKHPMVRRLKEICRKEKLHADSNALLHLVDMTDGDIRSCLNTLQFIKKKFDSFSMTSFIGLNIGMKDTSIQMFDVLKDVFCIGGSKQSRAPNGSRNVARSLSRVHQRIRAFGNNDKVLEGMFENHLRVRGQDPTLAKTVDVMDQFVTADYFSLQVRQHQHWEVADYTACAMLGIHHLIATPGMQEVKLPSSDYQFRKKHSEKTNILDTFMQGLSPKLQSGINRRTCVTDFLSSIVDICTPSLRPVQRQLLSAAEKSNLDHLLDVAIAFNIKFSQQPTENGFMYSLDPDIHRLLDFNASSFHRKKLPDTVMQMVAYDLDQRIISEKEGGLESSEREAGKGDFATPNVPKLTREHTNVSVAGRRGDEDDVPTIKRDFFGRPIATKPPRKQGDELRMSQLESPDKKALQHPILFRFEEGMTNAVRRVVRVRDFL